MLYKQHPSSDPWNSRQKLDNSIFSPEEWKSIQLAIEPVTRMADFYSIAPYINIIAANYIYLAKHERPEKAVPGASSRSKNKYKLEQSINAIKNIQGVFGPGTSKKVLLRHQMQIAELMENSNIKAIFAPITPAPLDWAHSSIPYSLRLRILLEKLIQQYEIENVRGPKPKKARRYLIKSLIEVWVMAKGTKPKLTYHDPNIPTGNFVSFVENVIKPTTRSLYSLNKSEVLLDKQDSSSLGSAIQEALRSYKVR